MAQDSGGSAKSVMTRVITEKLYSIPGRAACDCLYKQKTRYAGSRVRVYTIYGINMGCGYSYLFHAVLELELELESERRTRNIKIYQVATRMYIHAKWMEMAFLKSDSIK